MSATLRCQHVMIVLLLACFVTESRAAPSGLGFDGLGPDTIARVEADAPADTSTTDAAPADAEPAEPAAAAESKATEPAAAASDDTRITNSETTDADTDVAEPVHRYVVIDESNHYALINAQGDIVARTEIIARGQQSRGHMVFDFEGGIAPYRIGTTYGWLNTQGKVAVDPIYQRLGRVSEGYVPVKANGRWGLATLDGEVAVPARYESISSVHEGVAVFTTLEPSQVSLTDEEKRHVAEFIADLNHAEFDRREQASAALTKFGEQAAPQLQEAAQARDSEMAVRARELIAALDEKEAAPVERLDRPLAGVVNVRGEVVIPPKFKGLRRFSEGLAAAQLPGDDKWGYINLQGQWVIKPQFDWCYPFHDGRALVRVDGNVELRSPANQSVLQMPDELSIQAYHSGPQRIAVRDGKRLGFMDRKGHVVIDPTYDEVGRFHDGLAKVRVGQRWGYVNLQGQLVVKPVFGVAFDFEGPLAKVRMKDHWGYVNQQGEVVYRWPE